MNSLSAQKSQSEDVFEVPAHQLKCIRRHESRKKNIVKGTAITQSVKGALVSKRDLFFYRAEAKTESESVCDLVKSNGFKVLPLKCISNPAAKYKSFRLTVYCVRVKNLFNNNIWPRPVCVRKYFPPKSVVKDVATTLDTKH